MSEDEYEIEIPEGASEEEIQRIIDKEVDKQMKPLDDVFRSLDGKTIKF